MFMIIHHHVTALRSCTLAESGLGDAEAERAIRRHTFSLVEASRSDLSIQWVGVAMGSSGASHWIFPPNRTKFGARRKYENNGTSGLVYEAAIGGRASRCGAVEFCLKDWWLDRGGEAIAPSIGDWGAYDPRRRPWYEKAMDDQLPEAFWISSELTTWYGDVAINVSHSAERKKGPTTRRPMIIAPQN